MIDDLLKAGKITRYDYLVYALFECNELGREFFSSMLNDTFMDEPTSMEDGGIKLAFLDGRRSVFRDMHRAFFHIQKMIKENNNV
jgi:hypothetical protein